MVDTKNDESQLRFEAFLYLLEDPALDRAAFEARLAEDARLGEILAETVSVFHALQALGDQSLSVVSSIDATEVVKSQIFNTVLVYRVVGSIAAIAASLLLAGFLGWQPIASLWSRPDQIAAQEDANRLREGGPLAARIEAGSWNNVVWAWGDLRSGDREEPLFRQVNFVDFENALAMCEPFCDNDVPEWLVLATAAVLEDGSGVDAPIEQIESRTLIQ